MAAPVVTGMSPKEGHPGTRVTIRGENLGISQNDVIGVAICNKNCSMTAEWVSTKKIICRTSTGVGAGDIIVITRSGGQGTCTVKFTGLPPKKVGPNETSNVWVDETEYVDKRLDRSQKSTFLLRTDPLGLNSEDNTRNVQSRFSPAEMFAKGSPDPTDENFVPSWFLLERHFDTPFHRLKDGHAYMKKRANRNTNNVPLNHVKDSLPVFFEVHDTLSGIHHKMMKDVASRQDDNITDRLETILNEANGKADSLFNTVLTCKDRADSIRNTLNVLQRFKFLFNLPLNIDRNIQKGDYGVVINDYEKAKSLFQHTDVNIFKKVYKEVESKIESFRAQLIHEVQELPCPISRQKTLIRFLLGLGDCGEPAWDCLLHQHEWIQERLLQCKDKYLATISGEEDERKHEKIYKEYLAELTKIATDQLPEHWHLWGDYSSGVILSETGERNAEVEKLKLQALKHSKQMKGLLRDTIILLVNLIRAAFLPTSLCVDDKNEDEMRERCSYGMWPDRHTLCATVLRDCVAGTRQTLLALSSLNLPAGLLDSLKDVIHDLRVACLSSFLQETAEDVKSLHTKETWEVSNDGTSKLPSMFEHAVTQLVGEVNDVVQSRHGEEHVFARVQVQGQLTQLLTSLFVSFAETIERTCLGETTKSSSKAAATPSVKDVFAPSISAAERLVIGLSNADLTRTTLVHPLLTRFDQLHFPDIQRTEAVMSDVMDGTRAKLFEAYVEHRIEPLVGGMEPGMYVGGFAWNDCPIPTGVRRYVKLTLMNIVAIHAEVFSISPSLVGDVMTEVVKATAEEMSRLIQCVTKMSANGSLQARLEIRVLQESTSAFSSPQSDRHFVEATDCLPIVSASGNENQMLNNLKTKFQSDMLFQLRCFQH